MSKLGLIPDSTLFAITAKTVQILAEELANQDLIGNDIGNVRIFSEKHTVINYNITPCIVVKLVSSETKMKAQNRRQMQYVFDIDIYTSAKATATEDSDKLSAMAGLKLFSMVQYILNDPIYNYLELRPYVTHTEIERTISGQYTDHMDTNNTAREGVYGQHISKLMYKVDCYENNNAMTPTLPARVKNFIEWASSTDGYTIMVDSINNND